MKAVLCVLMMPAVNTCLLSLSSKHPKVQVSMIINDSAVEKGHFLQYTTQQISRDLTGLLMINQTRGSSLHLLLMKDRNLYTITTSNYQSNNQFILHSTFF